ncbi:MAG: bifunctional DNA-formamidopyrimidine glycosylase/DNA-(apurinic or apyrimidinic site) lyase [Pseudomonadota bacterium]
MPELPEVETVRRGLAPAMEGRVVTTALQRRPDLRWPFPDRFAERLTRRRILRLGRRSKYILADLDSGETLIIHLGMSGRMMVSGMQPGGFHHKAGDYAKHDHVVLQMDGGAEVIFNDARRFGAMDLWPTADIAGHKLLAALGPEPLANDFHADYLAAKLARKMSPIKSALLDQRIIAGLGNIYVCEALYRAGISPRRRASAISRTRIDALVGHINATIADALEAGGSSLRDYRQADGELGYFQHSFRVYDREGQPCRTTGCAGTIRRLVQSGRSSFYCVRCQR